MDEAANRATSATASPPPLGEDWEEGEDSSTSNAIESAPPAAKKRKTTSSSKKTSKNSALIEPSPPPGTTLPELAAVASQLVSPIASSSKSTLQQQQQSHFLPPFPLPSSTSSSNSSIHSKLSPISSVPVPLVFSFEELIQFRNGFKSELVEMEDRMSQWMSKGKQWLGFLDGAVDSASRQHQLDQHQQQQQQQQHLLDNHENHGFTENGAVPLPTLVAGVKKLESKSRTEQDLEDYLHGLPVFDAVALPLRQKVEDLSGSAAVAGGDKMNVDV